MSKENFTSALILAAGIGSRMRSDTTKQKMQIMGKSVLLRTALAFDAAKCVDELVVVCRKDEMDFAKSELSTVKKPVRIVEGGNTRQESAACGLLAVSFDARFVAVHDAARCMVTSKLIDEVASCAYVHRAASAVALVTDTVKALDENGMIISTVPRDTLRAAQTPQIFEKALYEEAQSAARDKAVTDDNMMLEFIGVPVYPVVSEEHNFKITTKKDIEYAEFLIRGGYVNE